MGNILKGCKGCCEGRDIDPYDGNQHPKSIKDKILDKAHFGKKQPKEKGELMFSNYDSNGSKKLYDSSAAAHRDSEGIK